MAELLRVFLAGKADHKPVWGGTWARDHRGAEMLRIDLDAAGIPYATEGPDGPLYADFHSLRHTYLTLLGRGGVDLRTAQELAGHSTPVLTARYSHRRLYDLAGAVEKLPSFLPHLASAPAEAALRATGTGGHDDSGLTSNQHVVQHVGPGDIRLHLAASDRIREGVERTEVDCRKGQENKPVSTSQHQPASVCISEDDGTRTRNHRIDSPVL